MSVMRRVAHLALLSGAVALAGLSTVLHASEAQAVTSTGSTTANVSVGSEIVLSNLTPSFTLTGNPGDTPSTSIGMTVTTNNFTGYAVTVQAAAATLAPSISGSTATIPISGLGVRETGTSTYTPISSSTPVTVHTQSTASASSGDSVSNDFHITIPFVRQDTYSGTLNYVATTL